MEIKKHIAFRAKKNLELIQYLKDNCIEYDEGEIITAFDILESSPHWKWIENYIQENEVLRPLSETLFSNEELSSAKWLTLRSKWHNGYPQPENNNNYRKGITYTNEKHCKKCGTGLIQIDSFRLMKQPKWGSRCFFMLNWISDELFVSNSTRNILENSDITGLDYREVKNKKGDTVLDDVWQLNIPYILKKGIIPQEPRIDNVNICPECGIPKYHPTGIGMLTYQKDIFEGAPDFVKTFEVFGWGCDAPQKIIVSQKVYRFLTNNKMDRGLVFEPIELV